MNTAFSRLRTSASLVAMAALAGACNLTDGPTLPGAKADELHLTIRVSSMVAGPGERIAVALGHDYLGKLGGVSGRLRYDASRLEYLGQASEDGGFMLVNTGREAEGELRLAAVNSDGWSDDIGSLVFEVKRPGYASAMRFEAEGAAAFGFNYAKAIENITVIGWAIEDPSLRVGDPRRVTARDLAQRVAPRGNADWAETLARPGEYRPSLRFGDVNLSGGAVPVDLLDVIFLLNVTVGNNELIVDADSGGVQGGAHRDAVIAGNVSPENAPGLGEPGDLRPGVSGPADFGIIDLLDVIAVLQETVNPAQLVVGEIIPGRPASLPGNVVMVTGDIASSTTWTKSNVYVLQAGHPGGIKVTGGATLTIEPGTRIEGETGTTPGTAGQLTVTRNGRIVADGTALEPIVFSCTGAKTKGCWGGLVINGSAHTNTGATANWTAVPGRDESATACNAVANGEGDTGPFGGCNDADSSGVLRYVVVEYSGFKYTATNELNGIAFQGVGSKTVIDFVQVHAAKDDGVEFFGGTVNAKHLYVTAAQDDGFDYTEGYDGKVQFLVVQADSGDGDKGMEQDNNTSTPGATPRSRPTIWNFTLVGKLNPASTYGPDAANNVEGALHIRVGARPALGNAIITGYPFVVDLDNTETCDGVGGPPNTPTITNAIIANNSVNGNTDTGDPAGCGASEDAWLAASTGLTFGSTGMLNPWHVLTPDFRQAAGAAPCGATPIDGFFDQTATYCGAVAPANNGKSNIPWYAGWTRGWQSPLVP